MRTRKPKKKRSDGWIDVSDRLPPNDPSIQIKICNWWKTGMLTSVSAALIYIQVTTYGKRDSKGKFTNSEGSPILWKLLEPPKEFESAVKEYRKQFNSYLKDVGEDEPREKRPKKLPKRKWKR